MKSARVSIVIPVYNGANYLRLAIDSALAQEAKDVEVLVVNDGSTDGGATEAIARSYGGRIRYLSKANGGVASALNAGIAAMSGQFFCWLSHDDIHLPHKTCAQLAEWKRRGQPDAVLVSDYRVIDAAGQMRGEVRLDYATLTAKPLYAVLRGSVHGCSVFVPHHLFARCGTFDETLPTTQDYDLWHRMLRAGVPFIHMPEVLIESRSHDEQGSKRLDHVTEARQLWRRMVHSVPPEEQARLEGSPFRFIDATARFHKQHGLPEIAADLAADAEDILEKTLVSVVIPVFNRVTLAVSAIESVMAQTHRAVEVIVVDGGSHENLHAIEKAAERHAPQIRLIRQANACPASARNQGWRVARGRYVAFLDADDLFTPDKLARQLRLMEKGAHVFSHTSYMRHDACASGLQRIASGSGNAFPGIIGSCGIATSTVMLRTDLREAGFAFRENLRLNGDVVLWLFIAAVHSVVGFDEALTVVRTSATSTAHDWAEKLDCIHNILNVVSETPALTTHAAEVARLKQLFKDL